MADIISGRRILVLGGARSGKSRYALHLAENLWSRPLFLATAEAVDEEMAQRIEKHRRVRGEHWSCVEEPLEIARVIGDSHYEVDGILIDCITVWLGNVLHREGAGAVEKRADLLVSAFRDAGKELMMVSNEVGTGIVPDNAAGRMFRDLAGDLNQKLAAEADTVVMVTAGLPVPLKGSLP